MAFGAGTVNAAGGAVADIFGGQEKRKGLEIQASGQRIEAKGFLLQAAASEMRAEGDLAEAKQYGLASDLAKENEAYTEQSTAIQIVQLTRQNTQMLGATTSAITGSGFKLSGSGMDILRSNAEQGALTKAVAGQQGLITEAGYREEAASYDVMKEAATTAASREYSIAGQQRELSGEQMNIADRTDQLAKDAETHGYITGGIKAAAAITSVFTP